MKRFFIFLLSVALVSTASAQWRDHGRRDHDGYRRGGIALGINIGTAPYYNGYYNDGYESRIESINHDFNHRIWEVSNSYDLSPWEKRRIIHELNEQREDRLNDLRRWHNVDYDRRY